MNKIKLFLRVFRIKYHSYMNELRMKYHSCESDKNAKLMDSYTNSVGNSTCGGTWTTNIYVCKVCGKRWDVD